MESSCGKRTGSISWQTSANIGEQYPGCIIPYLKADKKIDLPDSRVPDCEYLGEEPVHVTRLTSADDPEAVDGMPCNIQVIARSEQDEELMAAVELISKVLKE